MGVVIEVLESLRRLRGAAPKNPATFVKVDETFTGSLTRLIPRIRAFGRSPRNTLP